MGSGKISGSVKKVLIYNTGRNGSAYLHNNIIPEVYIEILSR